MITVYSRSNCPACKMVKKFLVREGKVFVEVDLDEDPGRVEEFKRAGLTSLPVVQVGEFFVSGFNPMKLKRAFEAAGV